MPIWRQRARHRHIAPVGQSAMPDLSFAVRRRSLFVAAIEPVALSQLFDNREYLGCCYLQHIRLAREHNHLRICQLSHHLRLFAEDWLCGFLFDGWVIITCQHIYHLPKRQLPNYQHTSACHNLSLSSELKLLGLDCVLHHL